jgi:hypothetical protein
MVIIVTRASKGSPLSFDEVDANFTNLQGAVADSLTASVASGVSAANAGVSAAAALDSKTVSLAQATASSVSATTSTTQATAAAASSANAVAARDLSIAAWAASMAPAEVLPSISKSIHFGTIVKSIIYDTSKDSDSGAWRKRCTDKSWYNETIYGTWRGQAANEAACRAISGAVTNDFYQNTTDGKYYALSAGAGQVEVFRGNSREFPEQVAVVAEASRVVLYDLTQPGTPMFLVFKSAANSMLQNSISSIASLNSNLIIGTGVGAFSINFIADSAVLYSTAADKKFIGNISARNGANGYV